MRFSVLAATLVLAGCTSVQSGLTDLSDRMGSLFTGPAGVYEDMDETDVVLAVQAMQQALETSRQGEPVHWINEETGNTGSVTPRRTFVTDRGVFCREYAEALTVADTSAVIDNTACRTGEGVWNWVG